MFVCPWDSPGKNNGVGCHGVLWESSQPRDQTCVSYGFLHWQVGSLPGKKKALSQNSLPRARHLGSPSVQFSSVVSDSLWPHGLQHSRLPCPSPTPRAYSKSHPWSRWCHLIISSSITPFSSCPKSFPASGSFPMSLLFASLDAKYWSFSFSISPSSEYSGLISFRIDLFDLLAVQGTLKSLVQHRGSKASILWCSAFFMVQLTHDYWKNHIFDYTDVSTPFFRFYSHTGHYRVVPGAISRFLLAIYFM